MVLFMWLDALLEWAKLYFLKGFNHAKSFILQLATLITIIVVLLWISVFFYGSFYYMYMPTVAHVRDVNLGFRSDCPEFQQGELCSFPTANLSLAKDKTTQLLMRGQPYIIVVDLDMPESPVNVQQGMFMVHIKFYTKHGIVIHTASRAAMLRYKSGLLRLAETLVFMPSLLLGSTHQKQTLSVQLDSYKEDPYNPTLGAVVEVHSKKIQIYSVSLRIHATFAGLRYVLFHFPVISAVVGIGTNMFFLCVVALLSWYQLIVTHGDTPPSRDASVTRLERTHSAPVLSYEERRRLVQAQLDRQRQQGRPPSWQEEEPAVVFPSEDDPPHIDCSPTDNTPQESTETLLPDHMRSEGSPGTEGSLSAEDSSVRQRQVTSREDDWIN